ncbi:unnamed protein product [Ixodes pacificus]
MAAAGAIRPQQSKSRSGIRPTTIDVSGWESMSRPRFRVAAGNSSATSESIWRFRPNQHIPANVIRLAQIRNCS